MRCSTGLSVLLFTTLMLMSSLAYATSLLPITSAEAARIAGVMNDCLDDNKQKFDECRDAQRYYGGVEIRPFDSRSPWVPNALEVR